MHEHNYLFYLRINVRHFDEYSNSGQEGTNCGLKKCAGAVVPLNKFDVSLTKLCNQATRKAAIRGQSTTKGFLQRKLWSKLKCAGKLHTLCVSILSQHLSICSNYKTVKFQSDKWYVLRSTPYAKSIIPRFKQTHTVKCKKGVFFCSCKYFEQNGIPCHHQLAVLKSLPYYDEPSHHDVSIVWWNHYMYYHKEPKRSDCCENDHLSMFYRYMETNDVKGPSYEQKHIDSMPIVGIVPKDFHDCLRASNCVIYGMYQT